jgi:hypothetical protein
MVADLELIERTFPEGVGSIEMLCVYEVVDGRILRATFATGEKKLFAECSTGRPDSVASRMKAKI